jgi:hypothetical protein
MRNPKIDRIVHAILKEVSTKVYVPPSLRNYYPVKQTSAGTRLDISKTNKSNK